MSFGAVAEFEDKIAGFFGAPYAVATDCCTHGVELCLRLQRTKFIAVPTRTYISIPFLATKLGIEWSWKEEDWKDYYDFGDPVGKQSVSNIIDAAVLWKRNSYIPRTFMCLSFQFAKHLSLGRGGMILTDDKEARVELKRMSYDGRVPDIPWRSQDINTMGYHYYMTPETAALGLEKLPEAIDTEPRQWELLDWPDLRTMQVFRNRTSGINK